MFQRVVVGVAVSVIASGCLQTDTIRCGDLVCPQGLVCYDALDACVRPVQIAACEGKADEDECSFEGAPPGRCISGVCASAGCGNHEIELGEACDDGNIVSGDGCSSDCRSDETCGNGIIDTATGEACDDGNNEPLDDCQPNCELPTCGDGIVDPDADPAEVCDDGNNVNGDGCNARCTSKETCQNGVIDPKTEDCDDANNNGGDGCSTVCKFEICGNGFTDVGEVCDDGNNVSGDMCSANCKSNETCGNGIPDPLAQTPEACDEGGGNSNAPNATCRTTCQPRSCGDGIVDNIFGESCEMGVAVTGATCQTFGFYDGTLGCTSACGYDTSTCSRRCGDGVLDTDKNEECDGTAFPANVTCQGFGYYSPAGLQPSCTSICTVSTGTCTGGRCGDGTRQAVETCDGLDLNFNDCTDLGYYAPDGLACNAACGFDTSNCTGGRCGDHIPNGSEYCDGLVPTNTCADLGQDVGRVGCSAFCGPNIFQDCSKRDFATESSPVSQILRDVWAIDNNDIYAVGDGGTIIHFNGLGWTQIASNTTSNIDAVWGSSATDVYAVGATGLVLHYNGTSWTSMYIGVTENLTGVHGTGPNDVWIVGGNSPNAKAVHWDGSTWTTTSFTFGTSFADVWTPAPGVVFAVGGGGTVQRFSGGIWTKLTMSPTSSFLSVHARSATDVYVAGGQGTGSNPSPSIQHFDGTTWTNEAGSSGHTFTSIVATASEVMALDYYSTTSVTTLLRRGSTFFEDVGTSSFRLWGATLTPSGELVAVGEGGTIQRMSLFTRLLAATTPPPGAEWLAAWAVSDTDVFVAGAAGAIRRRLNGNWIDMTTGTSQYLYGLWGADSTHLFAVGANGAVLRWDGTGTAWTAMTTSPSNTTLDFYDVWGTSLNDIFAVGESGVIYHYDGNASNQWVAMTGAYSGADLTGVSGSGPNDVYAVGRGFTERYTAGTWTARLFQPQFGGVVVRGVNDMFAVVGSSVMRSTDGAATWQVMNTGVTQTLNAIAQRGPRGDIWAVGASGTMVHFDDERWASVRTLDSTKILYSVAIGQDSVFMFGEQPVAKAGGWEMRHIKGLEEKCGNEWDDDADGFHDCADADCAGDPYCTGGGACSVAGTISCASPGNVVVGNNFTGSPFPDEYSCSLRTQNGPEVSYRFTATANGTVTATLSAAPTNDSNLTNLDVLVLKEMPTQGCDPHACVGTTPASGARTVTFTAAAGQAYEIVVDGALGAASTFTLTLSCQ